MFREHVLHVALPGGGEVAPLPADPVEELETALVFGLSGYAEKTGLRRAALGLSGGIDSAVTAVLACKALGAENVRGFTMPGPFSSAGSVEDALDLARRLGMRCDVVSIGGAYDEVVARFGEVMEPAPFGVTEQNFQARLRGVMLMGLANREGRLLLATSNKAETAVGYATLYGDMCGGLAPLGDLLKRDVYALGERFAREGLLPRASLEKPPSAELAPDQRDSDNLPPYEVLDPVLAAHIEEGNGLATLKVRFPKVEEATLRRILSLVARAEYKRKQAAPIFRVTPKAFGVGRRVPIVASDLLWADGEAP